MHFEFSSTAEIRSTYIIVWRLLIWCGAYYVARRVQIYLRQVVAG